MKIAPESSSRKWLRLCAWTRSFLRSSWRLEDYPLILVEQQTFVSDLPERVRAKRWRIDIAGWTAMFGLGDSIEEAEADLRTRFQTHIDQREKCLRPGRKRGGMEFASTNQVDKNSDLLQPFISDVLQLRCAFISDDSSLWDFHEDADNGVYYQRIRDLYGVDVSDIEGARIADILQRIAEFRK